MPSSMFTGMTNSAVVKLNVGSPCDYWTLSPGSFFWRNGIPYVKTSFTRYYELGRTPDEGKPHRPVIVQDDMRDCFHLKIAYALSDEELMLEALVSEIVT